MNNVIRPLIAQRSKDTPVSLELAKDYITFGCAEADGRVGGLPKSALHEFFPAQSGDAAAVTGFALALMLRAQDPGQTIVWVRQDMVTHEYGALYAPGLAEFGADPSSIIQVRVSDSLSAMRAAHEALQCCALGAVALEIWGSPKMLDLTATRRLLHRAALSRTPCFLIHTSGEPVPNAAFSRWRVRAAASPALAANAPGFPAFDISLLRHRGGVSPHRFRMEWDRDFRMFRETPLSRALAPSIARRPTTPAVAEAQRKAG
jgi:protein ImuA